MSGAGDQIFERTSKSLNKRYMVINRGQEFWSTGNADHNLCCEPGVKVVFGVASVSGSLKDAREMHYQQ